MFPRWGEGVEFFTPPPVRLHWFGWSRKFFQREGSRFSGAGLGVDDDDIGIGASSICLALARALALPKGLARSFCEGWRGLHGAFLDSADAFPPRLFYFSGQIRGAQK